MSAYNVFVLDDDNVFLSSFEKSLKDYLSTLPFDFSVYTFTEASGLGRMADIQKPDLIIADIRLEGETDNGIDVLKKLQVSGCSAQIIFLTGYLEYAPDIFGVKPLYFILKQEYEKRLPEAIDAFLQAEKKCRNVLRVNVGREVEIIPTADILYIERILRKTVIHCVSRTVYVTDILSDIIKCLPGRQFVFSHQSVIVNLEHVISFGNSSVQIAYSDELPISRSHAGNFRRAMALYLSE